MSATTAILDFAAVDHVLSEATKAAALSLLGDTLAGGAAGAMSAEAQVMLSAVRGWGHGNDARLLGLHDELPGPSAAWFNGFAIHCLEWDAVHERAVVHAMSVVTAALLAAVDLKGGSNWRCDRRHCHERVGRLQTPRAWCSARLDYFRFGYCNSWAGRRFADLDHRLVNFRSCLVPDQRIQSSHLAI